MKKFLMMTLVSVAMTASALASGELVIHPGRPMQLEGASLRAVAAVVKHADLLDEALKYGDVVTGVTQQTFIESSQVLVGFGTCTIDPARFCQTNAVLEISQGYMGNRPVETAEIRVLERGERFEGGLKDATVSVVSALAHVYKDALELRGHGRVIAASAQFMSPYMSRFTVTTRASAQIGGRDLTFGGATLTITARTKFDGIVPSTTYDARIVELQ